MSSWESSTLPHVTPVVQHGKPFTSVQTCLSCRHLQKAEWKEFVVWKTSTMGWTLPFCPFASNAKRRPSFAGCCGTVKPGRSSLNLLWLLSLAARSNTANFVVSVSRGAWAPHMCTDTATAQELTSSTHLCSQTVSSAPQK